MGREIILLNNYLMIGAVLFGIGAVGLICRRNMIVMFLSAEMMLQGVSLSLVAWSRFRNDFGGQMLVIFIIAVAACEAAIALALVTMLFRRTGKLDVAVWQALREADQPLFQEKPLPEDPADRPPQWPHLAEAGVQPEPPRELLEHRPKI
jgi:NADH-quinone oxidoreductase subunit K